MNWNAYERKTMITTRLPMIPMKQMIVMQTPPIALAIALARPNFFQNGCMKASNSSLKIHVCEVFDIASIKHLLSYNCLNLFMLKSLKFHLINGKAIGPLINTYSQ